MHTCALQENEKYLELFGHRDASESLYSSKIYLFLMCVLFVKCIRSWFSRIHQIHDRPFSWHEDQPLGRVSSCTQKQTIVVTL